MDEDIGFVLQFKQPRNIKMLASEGGLDPCSCCKDERKFHHQLRRADGTFKWFLVDG